MNENKDSFGLDNIQPLESTVREPVETSAVLETGFYTEPNPVVNEENAQFAFTPEEFVISDMPTVSPVETPVIENPYNFYAENPTTEIEPTVNSPLAQETLVSFTEMPITNEQPVIGSINEHPDAIIALHKTERNVIPNLPEENVDKSTIMLLVCLFLGMLFVIILLPYLL